MKSDGSPEPVLGVVDQGCNPGGLAQQRQMKPRLGQENEKAGAFRLGFRVWGCGVKGFRLRGFGWGFRARGPGICFGVQGLRSKVQAFGSLLGLISF